MDRSNIRLWNNISDQWNGYNKQGIGKYTNEQRCIFWIAKRYVKSKYGRLTPYRIYWISRAVDTAIDESKAFNEYIGVSFTRYWSYLWWDTKGLN